MRRAMAAAVVLSLALGSSAALATLAGAASSGSVTVKRDIVYASPDGFPLLLDAYIPAGPGPFIGVIVIHGGGWAFEDKKDYDDLAQKLAEEGLAAFSINYRLAPTRQNQSAPGKAPYPAAVEDVQSATQWVRDHASEFKVDPAKLAALGGSAGGHLAAMLGTMGQGSLDAGARVRAAVSWSGPMDLGTLASEGAASGSPDGQHNVRVVKRFLQCFTPPDCQAKSKPASPVTHVDPTDAPILLAGASDDPVPFDQQTQMAAVLKPAGVPYLLYEVPGRYHARQYEDLQPQGASKTVLQLSVDFIKAETAKTRAVSPPPSPTATPQGTSSSGLLLVALIGVMVAVAAVGVALALVRRSRSDRRVRQWRQGPS